MRTAIIIPAHNEENSIRQCLDSFVSQTHKPDTLLVVDDNSSDRTAEIAAEYAGKHSFIQVCSNVSTDKRLPGSKVVNAFNHGLAKLTSEYELIGKFDADIILPIDYFSTIIKVFEENPKLGLCSGLLYIQIDNEWVYEAIANQAHVRGPIKLYRKLCLDTMNGLRAGLGWDTADVLLAQHYGYDTMTFPELKVKHLRPTGAMYKKKTSFNQGLAYYNLRYGWLISLIASCKMAYYKKSVTVIWKSMQGYFYSWSNRSPRLVNKEEGRYIRKYRWRNIKSALF